MIKNKVNNRLLLIYILSTLGLVLLIAGINMKYLYSNLNEYDHRVFNKIQTEANEAHDIEELAKELEKIILERDVVIIVDYKSKRIVKSINLVMDDKLEDAVNDIVYLDDQVIELDRSKSDLSNKGYINDFSVKIDELFQTSFGEGAIIYFIPKWRTRIELYYSGIITSFSIACFFLAIVTIIIETKLFKRYFITKST